MSCARRCDSRASPAWVRRRQIAHGDHPGRQLGLDLPAPCPASSFRSMTPLASASLRPGVQEAPPSSAQIAKSARALLSVSDGVFWLLPRLHPTLGVPLYVRASVVGRQRHVVWIIAPRAVGSSSTLGSGSSVDSRGVGPEADAGGPHPARIRRQDRGDRGESNGCAVRRGPAEHGTFPSPRVASAVEPVRARAVRRMRSFRYPSNPESITVERGPPPAVRGTPWG